jgi:uncharacterized RDD family membrane protein YckC
MTNPPSAVLSEGPSWPTSPFRGEVAQARPAGFKIRLFARILDQVAIAILGFASAIGVVAIAANLGHPLALSGTFGLPWMARAYFMGIVGTVAYGTASEWLGGATLGKAILGLRVRNENLGPCTFRGALVRSLAFLIDGFFFGVVAYAAMQETSRRQRLGDRWGKTVVVHASSLPAPAEGARVAVGVLVGLALSALETGGDTLLGSALQAASIPRVDPATVPLSESRSLSSGLLTIHYPEDFDAKSLDEVTLFIHRQAPGGGEEGITMSAVAQPVTDDVFKYARLLEKVSKDGFARVGGSVVSSEAGPETCVGGHKGAGTTIRFRTPISGTFVVHACTFMQEGTAFDARTVVSESQVAREMPLLQRIIDSATYGTPGTD